jgi:hypothetical protein
VRCTFLDFGALALRSFSSAFSTESLGVSAMAHFQAKRVQRCPNSIWRGAK